MPTKSKKTIIRSFRISEESFNVLEEEAALLNVSINTLVDQIIGVHTSYERFKKFGMMRMARVPFAAYSRYCQRIELRRPLGST